MEFGLPVRFDDGGRGRLADDGRSGNALPWTEVLPCEYRRVVPRAVHECPTVPERRGGRAVRSGKRRRRRAVGRADGFDRHGLGDQVSVRGDEAEAPAVGGLEVGTQSRGVAAVRHADRQRGVSAFVPQVDPFVQTDPLRRHVLTADFGRGVTPDFVAGVRQRGQRGVGERDFDLPLAQRPYVGQPHAVRGQHAGERVQEDGPHAQRVRDQAGVLPARAPETVEYVFRDVVAALHGNLLDGVGHVLDRDAQKAGRDLLRRTDRSVRGTGDLAGQRREFLGHDRGVQRLVRVRPEHRGEEVGAQLAEHHVAVGNGQRSPAAIAGRAGIGAGRLRPHAEAGAVETQDGSAARGHGVDAQHGRAYAHARDLTFEGAFVCSRGGCRLGAAGFGLGRFGIAGFGTGRREIRSIVMRHVGGCAAHVEADDLVEPGHARGAHHADHAAGRTGQHAVLALEQAGVGQPAVRLHEHQRRTGPVRAGQFAGDPIDVAAQQRRQIRIDDSSIAARDQLHQRADAVGDRDLRKPDLVGQIGHARFVGGVAVAVHERHGHGADAGGVRGLERTPDTGFVERRDHLPACADPLVHLDDALVEHVRQHDVACEQVRPVLIADAQRVAEAARGDEHGPVAGAFQQRVGGDRGAHLDDRHRVGRQGRVRGEAEQVADALDRGVPIAFRVGRQQLVGHEAAVRPSRHQVGERAAAVDPDLPAGGGRRHGE